jgi:hypothetical protein
MTLEHPLLARGVDPFLGKRELRQLILNAQEAFSRERPPEWVLICHQWPLFSSSVTWVELAKDSSPTGVLRCRWLLADEGFQDSD